MSLVGLGATAVATAWLYRIDEVITVQGRLVPLQGGVEVKSPVGGQLSKVMVKNGAKVSKGQEILRFDVKEAKTEEKTMLEQIKLEKIRIKEKTKSNEQRQETLMRNISLTKNIVSKLRGLKNVGAISEIQLLQSENELESQKDQLLLLRTQQQEELNDSLSRATDLQGRLKKIRNLLENEVLLAPISGVVFEMKPDNDKYVTLNAEPLLKIVPVGELGGEVNVGNQDIGFIKGQPVKVRMIHFRIHSMEKLKEKIRRIGADTPPNELIRQYHFPVDIDLDKSNLTTRYEYTITGWNDNYNKPKITR